MRKHDARKWLHAILDLLPVILIPVFMIYSHRHQINDYQITTDKYDVVNFNQLIDNGNFESTNNWFVTGDSDVFFSVNNNVCTFTYATTGTNSGLTYASYPLVLEHIFYTRCYVTNLNDSSTSIQIGQSYVSNGKVVSPSTTELIDFRWQVTNLTGNYRFFEIGDRSGSGNVNTFSVSKVNLFDLTQMFGSGNEPTIQEFNAYFPNDYYDYTLSQKQLLNIGTQTYNNTDIGSQFVYAMYQPIHDYFNFNNVFNFNAIYDWMQLNIFNGTAPLTFFIVWNIVLYEFIMDLVFLIYALFMFFIDFCTNLIDRFHCKCCGGK